MAASESRSFCIANAFPQEHDYCLSKIHGSFSNSLENYRVCLTIVPIHANELYRIERRHSAESVLDYILMFLISEGIGA
jgi:hypothetical protein